MQPRRVVGAAVVVAVVAALFSAGCSNDDDDGTEASATTTTSAPRASTSSSSAGSSTSAAPDEAGEVEDWDGVRFDIGEIDRIDRLEDGRTIVVFDRMQVDVHGEMRSGKQLDEEPIIYANRDARLVNDNPQLRRYVVAENVDVLRLANRDDVCDEDLNAGPRWDPVTVDAVVNESLWDDYDQVALTFNATGLVTRIRFSTGC